MKTFASVLQIVGLAAVATACGFVDWRFGVGAGGGVATLIGVALERR